MGFVGDYHVPWLISRKSKRRLLDIYREKRDFLSSSSTVPFDLIPNVPSLTEHFTYAASLGHDASQLPARCFFFEHEPTRPYLCPDRHSQHPSRIYQRPQNLGQQSSRVGYKASDGE